MEKKVKALKRVSRPSYIAQLQALAIGEEAHFRIIGAAYSNFYNAKWRLEKGNKGRYEMRKVDDRTLSVTRLS